jgi:hypothetical protein
MVNELMDGHQDLSQLFLLIKSTFLTIRVPYATGHRALFSVKDSSMLSDTRTLF